MANTISKLSEKVVSDLFTEYPEMFLSVSQAAYINALQNALIDIIETDIKLGTTSPDYESVMLRLMQNLSASPEWADSITAKTSHGILRTIASGLAYGQFSIERAYQEAFLGSASSSTAIYSGVRQLGLRPLRRQPARVNVQLTRSEAVNVLTIPAYSPFTIGDMKFFNREAIIFNNNVFSVTKYLFQGVIRDDVITSDGNPFQKYTIGDGEHNASDIDVILTVDDVLWERKTDGIHLFGREKNVYEENTNLRGDIELMFGNGEFGRIPPISSQIKIKWVKTLGEDANTESSGVNVKWDETPATFTMTGITLTNIENGAERITEDIYKKIGPTLASSKGRAVRRADYKVQAALFPGVHDALFRGQAETAPGKRSMMNVITYTLLTDENWTAANHENFVAQFKEHLSIYRCEFLRADPIPVVKNVIATVYCTPDADLQEIEDTLILNIQALFKPRLNYLGRNMYESDISDVLNGRDEENPNERLERQIDSVVLDPTVTDTILTNGRQWVKLGTVKLNVKYTPRGGYTARLDLAPNQADPVSQ